MKEWLKAFEQITPGAYNTIINCPPPTSLDRDRTPTYYIDKVDIYANNPSHIFITLIGTQGKIEISLTELIQKHVEQEGPLTSLVSRIEMFELKLIWLDLGMHGLWYEGSEEQAKKVFFQSFNDLCKSIQEVAKELKEEIDSAPVFH